MKKSKVIFILIAILLVAGIIILSIPENQKELKANHFTIQYSSSIDPSKIMELAKALEENYVRISNDLRTTPSENIEVNIYAQRWRYIKATKNWGGSGNIEGIAKIHFLDHAWGEADSKKVAVHEFAHTVTLKLLLDHESSSISSDEFDTKFSSFPIWLWEAISVYEAQQFVDPKTLPYLQNGQHPNLAELNNRMKGAKIYSTGFTIIEYILENYGQDSLLKLITNYGNLNMTLNVSEEQFSKDWYGFVQDKYLK